VLLLWAAEKAQNGISLGVSADHIGSDAFVEVFGARVCGRDGGRVREIIALW
jgi:hypothetical protein